MQCPTQHGDSAGILLDFCARRLPDEQALAMERHIEACPRCRKVVRAQQSVWDLMGEWEAAPVSEDFDRRLYARIDNQVGVRWTGRIAEWVRFAWKPAVPVLLTAATALTFILMHNPAPAPKPAPQSAAADTVDMNQVEQTLDDLNMLHQLTPAPASSQSL